MLREVDERGYFGRFGGRFVPEVLIEPLRVLERAFTEASADSAFWEHYRRLLREYVGQVHDRLNQDRVRVGTDYNDYIKETDHVLSPYSGC